MTNSRPRKKAAVSFFSSAWRRFRKGILAKLQIFLQKTAEKFTGMEHSAEEKSKSLRDSYEERKSVKSDLKRLKAESKAKDAPKITEQAR